VPKSQNVATAAASGERGRTRSGFIEPPAADIVGRDAELALLREALAGLRAGRGQAVLIEGEAGIGKSALLAAALAGSDEGECEILRGSCDELTQRFPFSAVKQALGIGSTRSVAMPGAEIGALSGDPVLAALERLVGLVGHLCAQSPVVLALEDLHWADDASLLCWSRLCRATTQMPLLLIGTLRPVSPRAPSSRVHDDVLLHGGRVLPLTGLAPDGVAQMAAGLVHGAPGRRLLRQLESASGNPFYIRELVDAATRSGALRTADGAAELTGQAAADGPAAFEEALLQESIVARLGFLSAEAMEVLRVATLLNAEFSVSDVATVTGRTAVELMTVVQDAIAAGLLESVGPRLRFRHALLQRALHDTMPVALREALHHQVAQALIAASAPAERIAQQLLLAPDTAESWEVDWLAGNAAALAARVPAVAADLLDRALRHIPPADARRGRLEDQLAGDLFLLGRYERVEQVTRDVLDRTTDSERRGRANWLLGYALLRIRRFDEAATALHDACARADVPPVWRARFDALRAMVLRAAGEGEQAEQLATEALAEGRELGDATATAYALHALSIRHMHRNDFAGALHLIDQALPLTGDDDRLADLRMLLLLNRQGSMVELCRFDEASALARRTLARNELSGSPRLATLRMQGAFTAYETGGWDEAAAELEALTDVEPNRRDELHAIRALLAGHREEWPEAARHLRALGRVVDAYGENRPDSHHNYVVLAAFALESEWAGVRPVTSPHARWLRLGSGIQPQSRYKFLPTVVRSALAAGDGPTARGAAWAGRQEAHKRPHLERAQATAQWCEGLVHGDPAPVLAAARSIRELGIALTEGEALEDAALLTARAGDVGAARDLLDEALQVYTGLGASWDARRAASRLRLLGVRPGVRGPRRRAATGWQALTAMELQVAELMAVGRSNREIAARLFVSHRTVESHVSHILAKLQVASRREVEIPDRQAA
jgi:DNA-binding CsgD family transcriptional regulator/tetratricopeptide (TPR) repeat protein